MRLFLLSLVATVLALPAEDTPARKVYIENLPPPAPGLTSRFSASGILINYYTDSDCTQFTTQVKPAMYEVYNYQWSGTNSANIVKCPVTGPSSDLCHCGLCDQPNGEGNCAQIYVDSNLHVNGLGGPNCAYGLGIQSMYCEYY
jgi:hypothetical protein